MNTIKEQIAYLETILSDLTTAMQTCAYTNATLGSIHKYKQAIKKVTKTMADADDIYGPDQAAVVPYLDAERRAVNVEPYHTGCKPPVDVLQKEITAHMTRIIKYLTDMYLRAEGKGVELFDEADENVGCFEDPVTGQKYNAFEEWMLAKPDSKAETETWAKMLDSMIE